jgi:hypothetical protein
MGLQSYFTLYTGEDELQNLTNTINEYQKIWFGEIETNENIGEGIEGICLSRIIKPNKHFSEKYILFFGIG